MTLPRSPLPRALLHAVTGDRIHILAGVPGWVQRLAAHWQGEVA